MLFKQQSNTFFLATLQSKTDCKFGRRIYSYLIIDLRCPVTDAFLFVNCFLQIISPYYYGTIQKIRLQNGFLYGNIPPSQHILNLFWIMQNCLIMKKTL